MTASIYIKNLKALIAMAEDKEAVERSIYAHLYSAVRQHSPAPFGVSTKDIEILALVDLLELEDAEVLEEVCSEFNFGV
uniref:Uncharacterized protein n=1 Tax=viral metagenome TaxID=1070528 RepID=A0A6C0KZ55_9ZZZZ